MPDSYVPTRDADLLTWAENFSALITAAPATYGLIAGDATAIDAAVDPFVAAYATATAPSTRTPVTVAAKDVAKINMLSTVRPYAINISLNAGVLDADKIAVGVNPRTSTPTPIAAPTTFPELSLSGAGPLTHVLRYRDEEASPTSKAKPYGVIACDVWASASATPIVDPTQLDYIGSFTKCPALVEWLAGDVGKQAYYAARWKTRRGLYGPWSSIASFTVTNGT